ncbi:MULTISPECIES: PaaI family thioesterase [Marinobacter]|uniref:PaaI family thioesterase n=1 Tax=Marinobacter xestospongiae TaxID=994319 RepID=A0ABU3W2E8_9GAMM|nr:MULTISPECIES: PaaI family thioesterase [Marinobacter]MCG8519480.1 PaaI family thioesterase [Pseudomonadales bacterium]MCK7566870.1 PaaI family thioesterase [Marinobacter xestospongiae]MDV2080725.1 PaaI family thioesterase [Marinobacter xestospongiae]UDL03609.1 PaaI family thioesterase [Marinobacter sp. CA1]
MTDSVRKDRVTRFINTLQQARTLGLTVADADDQQLTLCLPYSQKIIGNPETGVIHGGAITTLMDTASGSVMICVLPDFELCPTLDLRVDYMRPAEPNKPVYARAEAYRITNNIIFTRCEAYQEKGKAIANCVGTFMRIGREATPKSYRDLITGDDA